MQNYIASIAEPINQANPVGERLLDDAKYEFIEEQLMKVGSLAHETVQWQQVESSAVELLSSRSKDIKLLSFLMQCLQQDKRADRLVVSIGVLVNFAKHFWLDAFPAPGDKGKLPRRRLFQMMLERSIVCAEQLSSTQLSVDQKAEAERYLSSLIELAGEYGLPDADVLRLQQKLQPILASSSVQAAPEVAPHRPSLTPKLSTSTSTAGLTFDTSNEREVQKTLQKIADFMCESDSGMAQGLRLRRYSTWFSITALPAGDQQGKTELAAVDEDTVRDFQDAINQGPDKALWRKLEASLALRPYWFDGHYLSAQIAAKLGYQASSDAIKEELAGFIGRLAGIEKLSFSCGRPFLSEPSEQWLNQQQATQDSGAGDWDLLWQQADATAQKAGLEIALAQLNQGLQTAKQPREQFYWRLLTADLLDKYGLGALARDQYQQLQTQISEITLPNWEPNLVNRINNKINQ